MILKIFGISESLVVDKGTFSSLIIKRPELYRKIVQEFQEKNKDSNEIVIMGQERVYFDQVVLIDNLLSLENDYKKILNLIGKEIEKDNRINYESELLIIEDINRIRSHLITHLSQYDFDYEFLTKLDYSLILKLIGFEVVKHEESLLEKMCTYMDLENKFFDKVIFVIMHINTFFNNDEKNTIVEFAKEKGVAIIGLDSFSNSQVVMGNSLVINEDYSCQ